MDLEIHAHTPESMPDAEMSTMYELARRQHLEAAVGDPFPDLRGYVASRRVPRPDQRRRVAIARVGGEPIGVSWVQWTVREENRHLARIELFVAPERRRAGHGRALLADLADHAMEDGRTLLQAWTTSRVPAGEEFCQALGAVAASTSHENRLELGAVDREQPQAW